MRLALAALLLLVVASLVAAQTPPFPTFKANCPCQMYAPQWKMQPVLDQVMSGDPVCSSVYFDCECYADYAQLPMTELDLPSCLCMAKTRNGVKYWPFCELQATLSGPSSTVSCQATFPCAYYGTCKTPPPVMIPSGMPPPSN